MYQSQRVFKNEYDLCIMLEKFIKKNKQELTREYNMNIQYGNCQTHGFSSFCNFECTFRKQYHLLLNTKLT